MTSKLLIIGASVRAAAFSAARAGLQPVALDRFGDRDLAAHCETTVVPTNQYPQAAVELARRTPECPWMFTGAFENLPDLVDAISRNRPLWGNDGNCLRRARDPFALASACRAADLPCPDVHDSSSNPTSGHWLLKPFASAGGSGIRAFRDSANAHRTRKACRKTPPKPTNASSPRHGLAKRYWQQYVEGESRSGVFVADSADCLLLGVTRQLIGRRWLHAPAFRYCGSIGPLELAVAERIAWQRLGNVVARFARLRGLFGIDAIVRDSVPWPVEVNPRYTASVEVLEHGLGIRAIELHRNACEGQLAAQFPKALAPANPHMRVRATIGKAVWYAPRDLTVPSDGPWEVAMQKPRPLDELPEFADIPPSGQQIAKGRPVVTLFARAGSVEECERKLREIAESLR